MTNICTKVTVRRRPIKNGQTSLYLDFYPPVRNPKTGKLSRREYLGLYIYTNPVERFQQEYNKSMIQKAEIIKCRRTESIINEEYGFLDRNKGKESFLEYFKNLMIERGSSQNWATAYMHFHNYTHGECRFCDLTVPYCQGFLDYLLSDACMHNGKRMMGTTANNNLTKLKCILAIAYEDGLLKENIAKKLVRAKAHGTSGSSSPRKSCCSCLRLLAKVMSFVVQVSSPASLVFASLTASDSNGRTSSSWLMAAGEWTLSLRRLPPLQSCLSAKRLCSSVVSEAQGRCSRTSRTVQWHCISNRG